jgi:hypothetical protein
MEFPNITLAARGTSMHSIMRTEKYFEIAHSMMTGEVVHGDMQATSFAIEDLYKFAADIQEPAFEVLQMLDFEASIDAIEAIEAAVEDLVNVKYLRIVADEVERVDYYAVLKAIEGHVAPALVEGANCRQVHDICLSGYLAFLHDCQKVSFRQAAKRMKDSKIRDWFEAGVLPVRVTRRANDIYLMLRAGGPTAAFYDAISRYEVDAQEALETGLIEACRDLEDA